MKKNYFLFFVGLIFLASCTPRYILITGVGAKQESGQVISTATVATTTQPTKVVYVAQQVEQQQTQPRRRGGIALSFQYGQSRSPYGSSQMIGGGIAIGGTTISANVGNMGYGQMYSPYSQYGYGQQRVVYPSYQQNYGYNSGYYNQYNPYGYGYNRPMYNQYGQMYSPYDRPSWYYTSPPQQYGGW